MATMSDNVHFRNIVFTASFETHDELALQEGNHRLDITQWLAELFSAPQTVDGARYHVLDIRSLNVSPMQGEAYIEVYALASVQPYDPTIDGLIEKETEKETETPRLERPENEGQLATTGFGRTVLAAITAGDVTLDEKGSNDGE